MASRGARFSVDSFLRTFNSNLERPVQEHLKRVYAALTISMLAAAAGAYVHVFTNLLSGNFLTSLVAVGLLLALMATPDDSGKSGTKRLGLLLGFAFCTGLGLGPLIDFVLIVNPSILATGFLGTAVIFASFSLSALFSPRGQYLLIGGPLLSIFSMLSFLVLLNIFIGSYLIFQAQLYIGLAVMCGFVLYDTQLIIEKRRLGDKDYVRHAVDLFIDFVNIFRRVLIILAQKENSQKKRKE